LPRTDLLGKTECSLLAVVSVTEKRPAVVCIVRTASLQDRKIRWPLHAGGRRAQLRARAFDPDPQGGQGADDLVTGVREGDRGESLPDYLGVPKFGVPKFRYGEVEPNDRVGVVTGLAWTASAASCSPSKA